MAKKSIKIVTPTTAETAKNSTIVANMAMADSYATSIADAGGAFDPLSTQPATSTARRCSIEALAESMRSLATEFAEARLSCADYIAATIITGYLRAIADRTRLSTAEGDAKPLAMFATLIGRPRVGKSSAIWVIEKPFSDFDRAWQKARLFGASASCGYPVSISMLSTTSLTSCRSSRAMPRTSVLFM
jgi:hypothetical protein